MILADRILERLQAQNMNQSELARRVHVRQSTINGLIRGRSASSTHLPKIARVLNTTTAYLEGETDDPDSEFPDSIVSSEEMQWVELLNRLEPKNRDLVLQLTQSLARNAPSPTVHDNRSSYKAEGVE